MTAPVLTAIPARRAQRLRWRVVDIVVAAILGVVAAVVFIAWNVGSARPSDAVGALLPGLQASVAGFWLIGGVLGGLVIRKPGAALFVELVGAMISAIVGNAWGPLTLLSGLTQGIGAELIFALFLYRRFGLGVAALAGAGAGVAMVATDLTVWYPGSSSAFATTYAISGILSGAVLAGVLGWLLVRALAATGALNRFAAGRAGRTEV